MNILIFIIAILIIAKGIIKGVDNFYDAIIFFLSTYIVIRKVIEILVFLIL